MEHGESPHRDLPAAGRQFCGRTRREFLWETGGGFASVALTALLGGDGFLARQAVAADGVDAVRQPAGAEAAAASRPRPRA